MLLEQTIKETIENFCNNLRSFTSLDVSNTVKQNGFSDVRHREVAQVVREAHADGVMEDFGYSRTLIDVDLANGGSAQAYLYHHQSVSPQQYDMRSQVAIPPVQAAPPLQMTTPVVPASPPYGSLFGQVVGTPSSPAGVVSAPQVSQTHDPVIQYAKTDCRLEIPREIVNDLGWSIGTLVAARECTSDDGIDYLDIRPYATVSGESILYSFHVDRWGRLRVPKTAMEKVFGYCPNDEFEITCEDNHLVISDA